MSGECYKSLTHMLSAAIKVRVMAISVLVRLLDLVTLSPKVGGLMWLQEANDPTVNVEVHMFLNQVAVTVIWISP